MNRRGQIFTLDLLISLFIFLLLFTSVILFLYSVADVNNPYSSYYSQVTSSYLNNLANQNVNTLTESTGSPSNWIQYPCSQISSIGLLENPYSLSLPKLYNITQIPVACLSQFLRAGDSFNITAYYLNGSVVVLEGKKITAGFQIPQNQSYIASVSRYVVMYPGGNIVRVTFTGWL